MAHPASDAGPRLSGHCPDLPRRPSRIAKGVPSRPSNCSSMNGEAAEDRSGDGRAAKGYVVALMGALGGAVVSGLVGLLILTLVVNRFDWEDASLNSVFDGFVWTIFLAVVLLPVVCFIVGGAGTYLLLRLTGHRAPLRTALYTMVLSAPCVFVTAKLVDGQGLSLLVGLVAASLIARRLALGPA